MRSNSLKRIPDKNPYQQENLQSQQHSVEKAQQQLKAIHEQNVTSPSPIKKQKHQKKKAKNNVVDPYALLFLMNDGLTKGGFRINYKKQPFKATNAQQNQSEQIVQSVQHAQPNQIDSVRRVQKETSILHRKDSLDKFDDKSKFQTKQAVSIVMPDQNHLRFDNNRGQPSLIIPQDVSKKVQENNTQNAIAPPTKPKPSHMMTPPPLQVLEDCQLKQVSLTQVDFLNRPVEQNDKLIKVHCPDSDLWTPFTEFIPQRFENLLQIVNEKRGYINLDDKEDGQIRLGTYKSVKGHIYEGEWKNRKRHGKGTLYMKDGSIYIGEWRNDRSNMIGRMINSDGNVYEGEWVNGQANGKGCFFYTNGQIYIGNWKNDDYNGKGRKHWPNNSYYDGEYLQGKRHGNGVFMWENGSFYCGEFKNNQIEGNGYYQWANGRLFSGEWKRGKINGKGRDIYENGQIYEGEYVEDKKDGFGIFYFNEFKKYVGQWKNDVPHGDGVMFENGVSQKGIWENGKHLRWV